METNNSGHLSYFKIENFKCFDALELNDIKKINLVLGDNNTGKSSILEALLFDHLPNRFLRNLFGIFSARSNNLLSSTSPYLDFFFNSKKEKLNFKFEYEYKGSENKEYISLSLLSTNNITNELLEKIIMGTFIDTNQLPSNIVSLLTKDGENFYTTDFKLHRIKDESKYIPFVKSGLIYDDDLVGFYSKNISSNVTLKKEFITNLHILDNNIYDIIIDTTTVIDTPILLVLFENEQKPIPLFMMGDGTIRLVRLILEIIMSKNARLMIDEIDNGIHYSRMKEVWRVLLKVADKNNTQLFITTHDAECLRTFKEVLEETEMHHLQEEVGSYTLIKNKIDQIEAINYNFREFEHAINYSLNVRGGAL
jgi:AAA15 family ATPase/GTPase